MKVFIVAVMLLSCFAGISDAEKPSISGRSSSNKSSSSTKLDSNRPIGSGNFSTTTRYYGQNGRSVGTERKYPERSYFYSPSGIKTGEKVNNGKRK